MYEYSQPSYVIQKPVNGNVNYLCLHISEITFAKYQRPVNDAEVRTMVEQYDPHRDRPIEVSYRDGRYYCFDGQHRIRAHQIMGMETILAQVHHGLTYEDEAALFAVQHDNEQRVRGRHLWNASLEAGDKSPKTQAILGICKQFGFRISADQCKTENTICCIREIQNIYDKYGHDGLVTLLFVLKTAWDRQPYNTHRDIIAGIGRIMKSYDKKTMDDYKWNRLRDNLAKMTPKRFLEISNTVNGRGGKRAAASMVKLYNRGLRYDSKNRLNEGLIR